MTQGSLAVAPRPDHVSAGPDRARAVARGTGELLITLGLVLLLFCAYELWFTGVGTARDQSRLDDDLSRAWSTAPPAPATPASPAVPTAAPLPGDAYARLYLPRLRGGRDLVVVEGVGVPELRRGPGHYPGTAAPGEVGNLVISGHRTTYGAPFGDLDRLQVGDPLVVQTREGWVTYRMTGSQVVLPSAVQVTLPVPGRPGVAPTEAVLTLTTCHPAYSAQRRLVVHALLQDVRPVAEGRPAWLPAA